MHRLVLVCLLAFACAVPARAAAPSPLEEAIEAWLGERDHWAFTQRAVEYQDGKPRERLERYDPSLPGNQRWNLLAIDGRVPTAQERAAWEKKKFKKNRRRFDSPIGDFFDFKRAKILEETAKTIRYSLGLRGDKSWLFPTDKVDVMVTIDKQTRALEHLSANVREPFKVLLGIARITNGSVDLVFDDTEAALPASAQPTGSAKMTVSRFGERVDFTWSEFKRVTPHQDRKAEAKL
jgi:hypothetical protein